MAQILARIDDGLHVRLKERAASEGRSLNELVTRALERELARPEDAAGARVAERLRRAGKLAVPRVPETAPTHDEVIGMLRGAGDAVLEGLEWARGPHP